MARCGNCNAHVSNSATSCPSCGASFDNVPDPGMVLVFKILGLTLIYFPFVLAALFSGAYAWAQRGMTWQISLAVAAGVFLGLLILIKLLGKIADRLRPPVRYILRGVEVIFVTGLQFLTIFSMAFSFFVPKEVQVSLMEEQITYLEQSGLMSQMGEGMKKIQMPTEEELQSGNIDIRTMISSTQSAFEPREYMNLMIQSNKNYFKNLLGRIGGEGGGQLVIGLVISLVIGLAGAWIIWIIYRGRRRQ